MLRASSACVALYIAAFGFLSGCDQPAQTPPGPDLGESVVGKVIRFTEAGDSARYRTAGWSKTEPEFTWTEGNSAKVSLPVPKDAGSLALRLTAAGMIGGDLAHQPVEVFANGQKVADWQVGNTAEFSATIPAEALKGTGVLQIEFRLPKATSPKALGQSEDPRVLGLAVHEISLSPRS